MQPEKVILRGSCLFNLLPSQGYCLFQVIESFILVSQFRVIGGNSIVGPGIPGVSGKDLLKGLSGFRILLLKFQRNSQILIRGNILRVHSQGFSDYLLTGFRMAMHGSGHTF